MKFYKLKHVPTGLYYQPKKHRGSHLSKNGKIYQTENNALQHMVWHGLMTIFAQKDSRIHKETSNVLAWKEYGYGEVSVNTKVEEWVKEEI